MKSSQISILIAGKTARPGTFAYTIVVFFVLLGCACLLGSCAPAISKNLSARADRSLTVAGVRQDPEKHRGKVVLWAGTIIATKNQKEGTLIEILQKPPDFQGRPKDVDRSDGRFLALYDGYLDAAIYENGRDVTVAGEIKGARSVPLGEIEYAYPLVQVLEIHLWPPVKERPYDYGYPYWYRHWPWYDPYWDYW